MFFVLLLMRTNNPVLIKVPLPEHPLIHSRAAAIAVASYFTSSSSFGAFKGSEQSSPPGFITTSGKLIGKQILRLNENTVSQCLARWMSEIFRIETLALHLPYKVKKQTIRNKNKAKETCIHWDFCSSFVSLGALLLK